MNLQHRHGRKAERLAEAYLKQADLRTITKNYRCRAGEIDLIMHERSVLLVFVEVRYRHSTRYGGGAESVTSAKRQRVRRTALHFLKTHPEFKSWPARFDVVALDGPISIANITWLKNAFEC